MTRLNLLALVVLIVLGGVIVAASRGECYFCPNYTCYGPNSCGGHCMCLRHGSDPGGECVSAD